MRATIACLCLALLPPVCRRPERATIAVSVLPCFESKEAIALRWGPKHTRILLLAWVLSVLVFTFRPLNWHLDYFARLGSSYRLAIIFVLVFLGLFSCWYVRFRKRGLWRWEPRLFLAGTVGAVLTQSPLAAIVCLWLVVASYCLGTVILRRVSVEASTLARIPLAIGAGLGAFILALIPIGLAGLYGQVAFLVLLLTPTLVFRRELVGLCGTILDLDKKWRATEELRSPLVGVAISFAPAFALAFLMASLAPSIAYDAISHHLPAARHYLLGGALEPLPMVEGAFEGRGLFYLGHSVAYSYYPQSFEELLTLAMGLGGQPAAQLVSPLFFILAMMMAAATAGLWKCSRLGCVVGLFAGASLPFAHWAGAIVKNDYALAFFLLAALYCVLRAGEGDRGWLILAAFFLGLSFGVKHVALFGAVPVALLMLNLVRRQQRPFRLALVLAGVFAVSGLFWHVRTYALTGSPIYPADMGKVRTAHSAVDGSRPSRWTAHLLYPWIAHFDGHKVLESPTPNPLGFYFVFLCACWVLTRRKAYSKEELAIFVFLGLYYLYWVYIWGVLRYAIAPILLLSMLAADRVATVSRSGPTARRATAAVFAYCLAFALLPTLILQVNGYQFPYFAGKLDRPGYLRATLGDYRSIESLNQIAGPGDRTLSINNCAVAYANDPAKFRCVRLVGEFSDAKARLIRRLVESTNPDFLMLPARFARDKLLSLLQDVGYREVVYQDERFLVFPRGSDDS